MTLHAALLGAILVIGLALVAVICGLLVFALPAVGVSRAIKQFASRD